jgi:hypothetical protein
MEKVSFSETGAIFLCSPIIVYMPLLLETLAKRTKRVLDNGKK